MLKKATEICFLVFLVNILSACSNLLFYPDKKHYHTPSELQLEHKDVFIKTPDGETLHAWWLPSLKGSAKGTVFFLHGNAENISTHFSSVAWLPHKGYNVLALDYRGYGLSTGSPNLEKVLIDIDSAFSHMLREFKQENTPIYVLGQSIGGSLAISFLGQSKEAQTHINGMIVDSSFASFQGIAREKLSLAWLTWPFQYPLSWLITSEFDPDRFIHKLDKVPKLYFHSEKDFVVPYHHGQELFEKSKGDKTFVTTNLPHIQTFIDRNNQKLVLEFLNKTAS